MKILLLLVLKYLTHSKISADQIRELQPRDIISAQTSLLDEGPKQSYVRVKRDSSINEFLAFEPENLDRSPRRKREARNQNQIFFRRRKKKKYRQSKIRRSLFKRGKFTTATPYSYLKKYGKGKMIRPPGLKYRKKYRFNRFKKTQDVALGVGEDGRAKVLQSPPKKRPPIHVRDYERGRGTRKALRGRVGERKLRDENDRFRKGADTDRKRARVGGGDDRATPKKSGKQYYDDELSDYSSELAKDSLPKQTKARKVHSTFGRITRTYPWGNDTKRKKATKFDDSSDDNTLLLSDEEQLTDVSSDISALRSELPDERPKHRKNASSSEYEQYSYAEDDSAIVKGEVVASKDESSPLKTTLLGPLNYDQYDIKKLDASIERVFKKPKKQKGGVEYDDPFEDIQDGYKDESSYESSSDTKQRKQKGRKSKLEKRPEKAKAQTKTGREPKVKVEKKQTPKEKLKKDAPKSDSYEDEEDYEDVKQKEKQPESKVKKDVEGSDSNEDTEDYDPEDENAEESDSKDEDAEEYESEDEDEEEYDSKDEDGEENDSDDEYTSDEEYNYEEMSTPKRRIPTWKMTQHPEQEKLYEDYTEDEDREKDSKVNSNSKTGLKLLSSKAPSKKKLPRKKVDESSIYEDEEYYSDYSDSQSQDQKQKSPNKSESIAKKNMKTTTRKSTSKKSATTKRADTSDYESKYDSDEYSDTDMSDLENDSKPRHNSTKDSKLHSSKAPSKNKLPLKKYEDEEYYSDYSDSQTQDQKQKSPNKSESIGKKNMKTTTQKSTSEKSVSIESVHKSDYESEYYSDKYSDTDISSEHDPNKRIQKKSTSRSGKMIDEVKSDRKTTKKERKFEEGQDTSTYDGYESDYYSSDEKPLKQTTKTPKNGPKSKKGNDMSKHAGNEKYLPDYSGEIGEKKTSKTSFQTTEKSQKPSPTQKTTKNPKSKKIKNISTYESHDYNIKNSDDESSLSESTIKKETKSTSKPSGKTFKPLPVRITKPNEGMHSKITLKPLPITKKSPGKDSKVKPMVKKSAETYEESEYDSQVTSYETSSENTSSHMESPVERATWPKEDLVERATWSKEDLKQSIPLKTSNYKTLYDDSEEKEGSPESNKESVGHANLHHDETKSTKTTLLRTTKSVLTTIKQTKKGFTTLLTTIKGFDSEEALKKISSKAAGITKKHVFVYNTKRKAYDLVSLQPISSATLEVTSPAKDLPTSSKTTHVTSIHTSNNTMTQPSEKTLKKRIVRKKTTPAVNDNSTVTRAQQSVLEDQTKKTTKKRSSRKTASTRSNITQKRSRKTTTATGSPAREETSS